MPCCLSNVTQMAEVVHNIISWTYFRLSNVVVFLLIYRQPED